MFAWLDRSLCSSSLRITYLWFLHGCELFDYWWPICIVVEILINFITCLWLGLGYVYPGSDGLHVCCQGSKWFQKTSLDLFLRYLRITILENRFVITCICRVKIQAIFVSKENFCLNLNQIQDNGKIFELNQPSTHMPYIYLSFIYLCKYCFLIAHQVMNIQQWLSLHPIRKYR